MSQEFKRDRKCRINSPTYSFSQLIQNFQIATRSINPYMTTVFHARPKGRFIEIKRNLRSKSLLRTNAGFNFLRGSF